MRGRERITLELFQANAPGRARQPIGIRPASARPRRVAECPRSPDDVNASPAQLARQRHAPPQKPPPNDPARDGRRPSAGMTPALDKASGNCAHAAAPFRHRLRSRARDNCGDVRHMSPPPNGTCADHTCIGGMCRPSPDGRRRSGNACHPALRLASGCVYNRSTITDPADLYYLIKIYECTFLFLTHLGDRRRAPRFRERRRGYHPGRGDRLPR